MFFLQIVVSAFLFIGGSFAGNMVANYLAPNSWISGMLGFFMFPVAFIIGMLLWQGIAIITGFFKWIFGKSSKSGEKKPGSFMMIPPAIIMGILTGVGIGFVSDEAWMLTASIVCGCAGLLYGLVCFLAAQLKLLPMMES